MGKFWKDAGERVLWTFLAAVLATAGVYVTDLPQEFIPVGTVLITTLKVLVAHHVGNPDTAALVKE
jgi:uncharacterized membrane protein YccC